MSVKGYATAQQVADYMGSTFTVAQAALAAYAIEASEQWIDSYTKHAWLETGPFTETFLNPRGPFLQVTRPPVASFTSLHGVAYPSATPVELNSDCGLWWVQSLRDGIIHLGTAEWYHGITVVYVPNSDPVPADIHLATVALSSLNMRLAPTLLDGVDPSVVQRYVVGGELTVEFRRNLVAAGGAGNLQVISYLDRWVRNYVIV